MPQKHQRKVKVPRNYYYRVHETRYRNIFGAGACFRQDRMNPYVLEAWNLFCSTVKLPRGALGVEFGSGTGINAITISQQGFKMIGLDISPTAVQKANELAREQNCSVQFFVGDMFAPALKESFDFAVNIWTLHAVGEQNLRAQHLSECYRILKPGGYLFLHNESSEEDVLNSDEEIVLEITDEWNISECTNMFNLPNGEQVQVSFPGHMPPGLSGRRSLREHQEELERAGFDVLECYGDVMRPQPSIPGNRVMAAFAYKSRSSRACPRRTADHALASSPRPV